MRNACPAKRPSDEAAAGRMHHSFNSDPDEVRAALAWIRHVLTDLKVVQDDIDTAEIVAAEALNNIVEHAYRGDRAGPIDLWLVPEDARIRLSTRDIGLPLPAGRPPDTGLQDPRGLAPCDLPEGGWGWGLIGSMTTRIAYRRIDGVNLLCLDLPARSATDPDAAARAPRG